MKKVLLLVLIVAFATSPAWTQEREGAAERKPNGKQYVSGALVSEPVRGAVAGPESEEPMVDTLTDYYDRRSGITVYSYSDNGMEYPITGTNNVYEGVGTIFMFKGSASVVGMLVGIAGYGIQGEPDEFAVMITPFPSTTYEVSNYFSSDRFDTSRTFSYIPFDMPVSVDGNFSILFETVALYRPSPQPDRYMIYSNLQGDGQEELRCIYYKGNKDDLSEFQGSIFGRTFEYTEGEPLDVDLMVLPVLQLSTSGVDSPAELKGITVAGVHPNPAADQVMLRFTLDAPGRVAWSLTDMTGRRVTDRREAEFTAGEHTVQMVVDGLTAGTYLYVIETEETRFAGQFQVIR